MARTDLEILLGEAPAYYRGYLQRVPEGEIADLLMDQEPVIRETFSSFPIERNGIGYAAGKWSPKEMMGHLLDVERVFQYRVFTIARGDQSSIPGMDEDEYVRSADFNRRRMDDLLAEFSVVRASSVMLLRNLSATELARIGTANGKPVSARAIAAMLYGHPEHHLQVLRERYAWD